MGISQSSNQLTAGCCCQCPVNCNDRENKWIKENAIKFLNIVENNVSNYSKTMQSLIDCIFIYKTLNFDDCMYDCVICKDKFIYPIIHKLQLADMNEPIPLFNETHKKLIQHIKTHISKKNVIMVVYIHKCLCLDKPIK